MAGDEPANEPRMAQGSDLAADLDTFLARHEDELIEFRRDLHAHPELANAEHRTTRRVALRLAAAPLLLVILPKGTGLMVDIGTLDEQDTYTDRPVVALRAEPRRVAHGRREGRPLPLHRAERLSCVRPRRAHHRAAGYRPVPGRPGRRGLTARPVARLVFQPAEEAASGALDVLAAGGITSVGRIFALHCDPGWTPASSACVPRDHGRLRPDPGPGVRAWRPHGPAAPDRGPGVRPGQDHHRSARRAVPAGRSPGRA